jgi:branched-chain amino acid transport system ATP-binding protein
MPFKEKNMKIFEVRNLTKNFGGLQAVSDVFFNVNEGEILGIIGPNGSGKTTVFNLITNFIRPDCGEVNWKGEDITGLRPDTIAQRGIVRTFQITRVFPKLTLFENLAIGHHLRYARRDKNISQIVSESIESLLAFFHLEGRGEALANSLAYGERKKLSMALALSCDPELLLEDEPAAGLNQVETEEIVNVIRNIQSKGMTQILVDHDMKFIMGLCDRIICLNFGRKIAEGTPQEIQQNEEVIQVYLGE